MRSLDEEPTPPEALEELTAEGLYDSLSENAWRTARRMGLDPAQADDVVQQVFLVVHRRLGEFRGLSSAKTWVFGILMRTVADFRRTARRRHLRDVSDPVDPDEVPSPQGDPLELFLRKEALAEVDEILQTLEERERAIFILSELEELSPLEIAAAFQTDVAAIYPRLRAARADFEKKVAKRRRRENAR